MAHTVSVDLVEKMQFRLRTGSGHEALIDASIDVGGEDAGPRPMELLLAALAGCGGMDVISMLRKMRQEITAYTVTAGGETAAGHPRMYTGIELVHRVTGVAVGEPSVRRAIYLSMSRYCPVFATLSPAVPVRVAYEIAEPDGSGLRTGEVRLDGEEPPSPRA
jgi:putative redox protein